MPSAGRTDRADIDIDIDIDDVIKVSTNKQWRHIVFEEI
jgi:hypothetical protein